MTESEIHAELAFAECLLLKVVNMQHILKNHLPKVGGLVGLAGDEIGRGMKGKSHTIILSCFL